MLEHTPVRHPLFELTRGHLIEFVREPAAIFWVFGFPVLVAIGLGIAFRTKPPERFRVGASEERVRAILAQDPGLEPVLLGEEEARESLRTSKIVLWVRSSSATPPQLVLRSDPTQPESRAAHLEATAALERGFGRKDVLHKQDELVTEAGSRYIDFLVPALLGMNVMGSCMWGLGYAVVDTRSRRLMKRLAATPMSRAHYLLSFMLSRLVFLVLEVGVLLAFGALAFGVEVRGSLLAVWAVTLLGALAFSGIALLVAARPRRVEVASGWMNFVMMPMYFLSGTFFSWERFPEVMHPLIRALPLTALNDALRGVINRGASLPALGWELLVLALWGVLSFSVALRIFRWQ